VIFGRVDNWFYGSWFIERRSWHLFSHNNSIILAFYLLLIVDVDFLTITAV